MQYLQSLYLNANRSLLTKREKLLEKNLPVEMQVTFMEHNCYSKPYLFFFWYRIVYCS